MRILYYDCFCGISGDMNLGAMVDLGVDFDYLAGELKKLKIDDEFEIRAEKKIKKGIEGTKVDVILKNDKESQRESEHSHNHHHPVPHPHTHHNHEHHVHNHGHNHGHHDHHHNEDHDHQGHHHEHHKEHAHHNHPHVHRNLFDVEKIIDESELTENVKKLAKEIFLEVARAESHVHGKPLDEIHFHEVGATDSLVDVVGAAVAIDSLKIDRIVSSTVELGGGFVNCAHGKIPVPAPATLEILKEVPVKTGLVPFETTTPTGAAILKANVTEYTDRINFKIDKIGYGLGNRDLEVPNVLRVFLGEEAEKAGFEKSEQYIIETNIDDMNPELLDYTEKRLFEKGALDVYRTPIIMKKGRAAIKLTVLINQKDEDEILRVIFEETTTIGIRKYPIEKIRLPRKLKQVPTKYGEITVKEAYGYGGLLKYKAEYDDCKAAAIKHEVSIHDVYREIDTLMRKEND